MGNRKSKSVRQLATENGLEFDEALVRLWSGGLDDINDIDDRVSARRVKDALKALGVSTGFKPQTVKYWENAWGLNGESLLRRFAEYGINVSPSSRKLPRGALRKLGREFHINLEFKREEGAGSAAKAATEIRAENEIFEWAIIGRQRSIDFLDLSEILDVHKALVEYFADTHDPITPPGTRDQTLLESAISRPGTSLGDELKYPTVEMAGAALLHSLIHNHPFYNGNKRTALVSLLVFLDRNDLLLTCSHDQVFRLVLQTSQHSLVSNSDRLADREVQHVAQWIRRNSRALTRGERPIKWTELRRILHRYDCTISTPIPGNKIKICRTVRQGRFIGIARKRRLEITVGYAGDGREMSSKELRTLRQRLQLDDPNGIDSAYFYGFDRRQPDEFIAEHRNLLKRLARL